MANNDFNNLGKNFQNPSSPGGYYTPNQDQGMMGSMLQDQLSSIMRSFKDELSFNMQSLNLTLSTLSGSMQNLSSKIGELGPNTAGRFITSGLNSGGFLGNVSQNYANYQPINNVTALGGLLNSAYVRHPFNVSPLEYYTGMDVKRSTMGGGAMVDALGSFIGDTLPSLLKVGGTAAMVAAPYIGLPLAIAGSIGLPMLGDALRGGGGVYTDNMAMVRRMSGRFSTMPFNLAQSMQFGKGLRELTFQEVMRSNMDTTRLGMTGYRDITMLGLQGDLFKGKNPDELLSQVEQTAQVVKLFTGILGSNSVKEAMEALVQMKNMGLNAANMSNFTNLARTMGNNAYGYGYINSMSTDQMMRTGMQIAQSGYGTYGIPSAIGINQGMQSLSYVNELRKRNMISDADLALGGGPVSIASRVLGVQGQVMQSGMGQSFIAMTMQGGANSALRNLRNGSAVGTLGSGLNAMLSGDPFVNIASARIDTHNILAGLQNGEVNQASSLIIQQMLQMNPIYTSRSSANDKFKIGSSLLMDWFNIDSTTAKTIMRNTLNPGTAEDMNYRKNLVVGAGYLTADRYRDTISSQLFNAVHGNFEKAITSNITMPVMRMGQRANDALIGWRNSYVDFIGRGDDVYKKRLTTTAWDSETMNPIARTNSPELVMERLMGDFAEGVGGRNLTDSESWRYLNGNKIPSREKAAALLMKKALKFDGSDPWGAASTAISDFMNYWFNTGDSDQLGKMQFSLLQSEFIDRRRFLESPYWSKIESNRNNNVDTFGDLMSRILKVNPNAKFGDGTIADITKKFGTSNDPILAGYELLKATGKDTLANYGALANFDPKTYTSVLTDRDLLEMGNDFMSGGKLKYDPLTGKFKTHISLIDGSYTKGDTDWQTASGGMHVMGGTNAIEFMKTLGIKKQLSNQAAARETYSLIKSGALKVDANAEAYIKAIASSNTYGDMIAAGTDRMLTQFFDVESFKRNPAAVRDVIKTALLNLKGTSNKDIPNVFDLSFYNNTSGIFDNAAFRANWNANFKRGTSWLSGEYTGAEGKSFDLLNKVITEENVKGDFSQVVEQISQNMGISRSQAYKLATQAKDLYFAGGRANGKGYTWAQMIDALNGNYIDLKGNAAESMFSRKGFHIGDLDPVMAAKYGTRKAGQNIANYSKNLLMNAILRTDMYALDEDAQRQYFTEGNYDFITGLDLDSETVVKKIEEGKLTDYLRAKATAKYNGKDYGKSDAEIGKMAAQLKDALNGGMDIYKMLATETVGAIQDKAKGTGGDLYSKIQSSIDTAVIMTPDGQPALLVVTDEERKKTLNNTRLGMYDNDKTKGYISPYLNPTEYGRSGGMMYYP